MCSFCLGLSKSNRLQRELQKNDFEDHHCVSAGKTKTSMTRLSTSKLYRDHHLHHEWQWLAAMTPHRFSQLLTVGVDKHITICLKFQANNHKKKLHLKSLKYLWKQCGRLTWAWSYYKLIQLSAFSHIQNVQYRNNKIQLSASRQETSLEGKFVIRVFSKILWCSQGSNHPETNLANSGYMPDM
jgi:hypothetical protein